MRHRLIYGSLFVTALSTTLISGCCKECEPCPSTTTATTTTATTTSTQTQTATAEIMSPSGSSVSVEETVKGTVGNIPSDHQLWLVLQPGPKGSYYPQEGPIEVTDDGTWTAEVFFGESDTLKGTPFTLMLVVADPAAGDVFSTYFNKARKESSYPGITELPDGAVVAAEKTYTRQ